LPPIRGTGDKNINARIWQLWDKVDAVAFDYGIKMKWANIIRQSLTSTDTNSHHTITPDLPKQAYNQQKDQFH
jgi:hypothetical protein